MDDKYQLRKMLMLLQKIQKDMPVIFPIHHRCRNNIGKFHLGHITEKSENLKLIKPLGYIDFLSLMMDSMVVLTDSGGVQEETTVLKIPCLTMRENTERPITIKKGTNQLVGIETDKILDAYEKVKKGKWKSNGIPKYWDGKSSQRIIKILKEKIY